jgi:hypothetical protein
MGKASFLPIYPTIPHIVLSLFVLFLAAKIQLFPKTPKVLFTKMSHDTLINPSVTVAQRL